MTSHASPGTSPLRPPDVECDAGALADREQTSAASCLNESHRLLAGITPGKWVRGQWQYEVTDAGVFRYTTIAPRDDDDASVCVDIAVDAAQHSANHRYVISGCGCCGSPSGNKDDVEFIARAPDLVRGLIEEIERLRAAEELPRLVRAYLEAVDEFDTQRFSGEAEERRQSAARVADAMAALRKAVQS